LIQLRELWIYGNQIKEIPLEICHLIQLEYFSYHNNPIENLLNPIIQRFINRIENRNKQIKNVYNDSQNVHSSSIQQSVKSSIYNLMKEVKEPFNYNYMDDSILMKQTKQLLNDYCKNEEIHSQLECTFGELLDSIFLEISKMDEEKQMEIKKRINEEIKDSIGMCFTGRIVRIVNSLSGYSDKVSINISDSEEIGNVISLMKSKYMEIDEIKKNVEKELLERGYNLDVINEWIQFI
jgi:hypothetical protein